MSGVGPEWSSPRWDMPTPSALSGVFWTTQPGYDSLGAVNAGDFATWAEWEKFLLIRRLRRARAVDFVAHRNPLPPHVEEIFLAHNPPPSCWNERIGKRDWEDALRKWSKSRKAVYRALQR